MSATINVLRTETEDTIEMYVDPEDKIEDIIKRCKDYWEIEGPLDEYILFRGNTKLTSSKTVISSDLQHGDIVKFYKKEKLKKGNNKRRKDVDLKPKEILSLSKGWLKNNIGLKPNKLKLVEKEIKRGRATLHFKNTDHEEYYTILMEGKKVKKYIPALIDYKKFDKV